jgi:hypothetical protein
MNHEHDDTKLVMKSHGIFSRETLNSSYPKEDLPSSSPSPTKCIRTAGNPLLKIFFLSL